MSQDLLRTLQRRHAFDPTPPEAQLGRLHVPFDHLTRGHDFEDRLAAACRRGERVTLIGPSGGGKSSITEHVLFPPNLQDLAPIKVRVGLDPLALSVRGVRRSALGNAPHARQVQEGKRGHIRVVAISEDIPRRRYVA